MRAILWGINYAPELTGIAPYNRMLCDYLVEAGHEVEAVTTFPYYPEWRKRPEDRGRLFRRDILGAVPVHRCWHYVPEKVGVAGRMIHEASFLVTSFLRLLTLPRADVYLVVSPPLLGGVAASVLSAIKRAPFVFHVQDLQPDAALGLGMVQPGNFTRLLYAFERHAYRRGARVSGISRGMLEAFRRKGVPEEKIVYFPNPVALEETARPAPGEFRRAQGYGAGDFLIVYSGNLGVKQGIEIVVEAAQRLPDPRWQIVICGEGARKEHLAARIASLGVRNVRLLPLLPEADYHRMLVDADVCLITQQKGAGGSFFPSKLLPTLAFSKPVVTVADEESELSRAVAEGGFGRNVLPDRPEELARALLELADQPEVLRRYGEAGRGFVRRFARGTVLADFSAMLEKLVADQS